MNWSGEYGSGDGVGKLPSTDGESLGGRTNPNHTSVSRREIAGTIAIIAGFLAVVAVIVVPLSLGIAWAFAR